MNVSSRGSVKALDADQTRSDADRVSSERDQEHADADRRASQRDQSVSDHDRSAHAATDAKFSEAFAAIEAERARSVAEREAAADNRVRAAEERVRAAHDRASAAQDRERAAVDRQQATTELDKAQLDDLTGFYRLGLGTAVLQREIDRSRRSGGRLAFAYLDVDGLKRVNDEHGHAAGDAVLKAVAGAIRSRIRSYDPVVRVGGDEFVCAVTDLDPEQAGRLFHDIQAALANGPTDASLSFGLATLRPDDDLGALLERSDRDLRSAKSASHAAGPLC